MLRKEDVQTHTEKDSVVLRVSDVWLFDATKRNQTKEDVPLYRHNEKACAVYQPRPYGHS